MTTGTASDVYYDPYDPEIFREPYEVYRRLREEAPFYYNEAYDFYALSLFDDVERCMADRDVFLNCRGDLLEHIKQGIEAPPATLPFEDGQRHTAHRALMARVFTPKAMSDLEPQVRDYCSRILDEIVGTDHFDFVADLGARLPMRVIGMLLGIPEEDQESLRVYVDGLFEAEMGKPKDMSEGIATGEVFADYIDWR